MNIWTDWAIGAIPERYPQAHCTLRRSVHQIYEGRGEGAWLEKDCRGFRDVL
jgi:hypothetical protein